MDGGGGIGRQLEKCVATFEPDYMTQHGSDWCAPGLLGMSGILIFTSCHVS